jgi:hypothetical protein
VRWPVLVALALAALTLLAPSAPGYDAWAWLGWGREVAHGTLDTVDGPAFKPLPVAVIAVLQPFGAAVPDLWLVVARAGAVLAVLLAARLAVRLAAPRRPGRAAVAGGAAAVGVLACSGWWWHAAIGGSEGLFLALGLAAADRALDRRHGQALALGLAAGLLRPEAWLALALFGLWLWRHEPRLRPWLVAAPLALAAAWFGPELAGSGDLLRSGDRARIPNPGQPAAADRPALASLGQSLPIALAPVLVLAVAGLGRRGPVRLLAAAGLGWLALVAAMAKAGFSGEPRYALAGAALLAVPAAVVLACARGPVLVAGTLALAVAALLRADVPVGELRTARADAQLWDALPPAIAAAGGRDAVLARGRPVTGRFRGTGVAYALAVPKRAVGFDPAGAGTLLRSRIRPGAGVQPPLPAGGEVLGASARWQLVARR